MEEGAASTEEKRRRFTVRPEAPDAPPVPSLFRPSAASGPPGGAPAPALPGPLSYAEYVMRQAATGEAKAPAGEAKAPTGEAKAPTGEAKAPTSKAKAPTGEAKAPTGEAKAPTGEARAPTGEAKAPTGPPPGAGSGGNGAGDVAPLPPLKPGAKSSSIIVSPRQRGNPLLRFVRNVPWEFGDVVPDYVLGQSTCALFLSLRYHNLNPDYIHERLRRLGRSYALQLLLLQVDVKDPHQALKELAKMCLLADCTLILAWSAEEAGRYLETYKAYEQKPADLLKERVEQGFLSRMTDCLTSVKSVNKTDTASLLAAFGSLAAIAGASREDLSLCPGIGPQKAKRLFDVLHEPFLKAPK